MSPLVLGSIFFPVLKFMKSLMMHLRPKFAAWVNRWTLVFYVTNLIRILCGMLQRKMLQQTMLQRTNATTTNFYQ